MAHQGSRPSLLLPEVEMPEKPMTTQSLRPAGKTADQNDSLLNRILNNPRIPSPPTLALQIFQKIGEEDCEIAEVTKLLGLDAGLSAKILKTLNSAIYGRSRPVTNVRQAVNMLGMKPLRSLVLGLALPAMQAGVEPDVGLCRFWK